MVNIKNVFGKGSIKGRWITQILIITVAVLITVMTILLFSLKMRYDNAAEMAIRARVSKSINTFFEYYNDGSDETFAKGASEYINNFQYKDTMAVWVLDKYGHVLITSDGFGTAAQGEYEDYTAALYSEDNSAVRKLRTQSGEPVTAMTYILRDSNSNNYGAVRFLISMNDMYKQLVLLCILIVLAFIVIIIMITSSGMYFVSTIVKPVESINKTTGEIAKGNFKVRINNTYYDDEIGQLCDSINNMAAQLSEIDKMKNEFISTVSHEIRTPLTAIKGWSETLRNNERSVELTEKGLDIIIEETTRLSSMVEELLDFSRIQSNSIRLIITEINLVEILEQICTIYRQKVESDQKTLIFNCKNNEIPLLGDSDRIRQVVINILDNAVKYTEPGGEITITVERNKNCVKIYFEDNGCGISPDDLIHIKEKFYKANNTVRGTGIGLAVADEIIRKHGGEINIKSEISKGTLVEVILPLKEKGDYNEQ